MVREARAMTVDKARAVASKWEVDRKEDGSRAESSLNGPRDEPSCAMTRRKAVTR